MDTQQNNAQNQLYPGIPAYIGQMLQAGIELRLKRSKATGDVYIKKCLYNAVKILQMHPHYKGRISFDEFAERVYIADHKGSETGWNDELNIMIRYEMEDRFFVSFSKEDIESAVVIVAQKNKRNPLKTYIDNLPEWDGISRCKKVLQDYFGVKPSQFFPKKLIQSFSVKFFISIIARMRATIHNPVKVDTVLVLHGKQGKHKSTALGVLALEHIFGKKYFMDTPFDITHKDAYQVTEGKLIVELQELAKRSKDKESEKAFISMQIARYRKSHAKHVSETARKCVYVATTNQNQILADATGSRRFWVVSIGEGEDKTWKIDVEGLRKNIELLYAEALHRFDAGENWWLSDEEEEAREKYSSDFADRHPMYNIIAEAAKELYKDLRVVQIHTLIERIYKEAPDSKRHLDKNTRQNKNIIADVLLLEGYTYKRKSIWINEDDHTKGKVVKRGWFQ